MVPKRQAPPTALPSLLRLFAWLLMVTQLGARMLFPHPGVLTLSGIRWR